MMRIYASYYYWGFSVFYFLFLVIMLIEAQGTVQLVSSIDTLTAIITKAQNKKCSDRVSRSFLQVAVTKAKHLLCQNNTQCYFQSAKLQVMLPWN